MKLGFHISIQNGIDKSVARAKELGCTTFQIFTQSPRMWRQRELREKEVQEFKKQLAESKISPVFSHMPYLPNLSTVNPVNYRKSVDSLLYEVERCRTLEIPYIVTHVGSHLGEGVDKGISKVVSALDKIGESFYEHPMILLENSSGKGNDVGSRFDELGLIIERSVNEKIGVCFDTCHAFSKGYELRTEEGIRETLEEFDRVIGLKRLKLVHLNDSKWGLGAKNDNHDHVGLGHIGGDGFRNILKSPLSKVPMVMETPMDERRTDRDNMEYVTNLAKNLGVN